MNDAEYRQAAREQCIVSEGVLEVDDDAVVSRGGDPGAYVQAWIWVPNGTEADDEPTGSESEVTRCGESSIARAIGQGRGREIVNIIEPVEPQYCANDPCEAEAVAKTSTGAPLCWTCAEAYRWGQANPDPLEDLDEDEVQDAQQGGKSK